jgi:hypothetical protein
MNLMSKSSNCSVLEVIEPPSTAGSDNDNDSPDRNLSGNNAREQGLVAAQEPEYENAVAAVVQNGPEGIMVDPMGCLPTHPPPPPAVLVPPPPVRVASKQQTAVDQVIVLKVIVGFFENIVDTVDSSSV